MSAIVKEKQRQILEKERSRRNREEFARKREGMRKREEEKKGKEEEEKKMPPIPPFVQPIAPIVQPPPQPPFMCISTMKLLRPPHAPVPNEHQIVPTNFTFPNWVLPNVVSPLHDCYFILRPNDLNDPQIQNIINQEQVAPLLVLRGLDQNGHFTALEPIPEPLSILNPYNPNVFNLLNANFGISIDVVAVRPQCFPNQNFIQALQQMYAQNINVPVPNLGPIRNLYRHTIPNQEAQADVMDTLPLAISLYYDPQFFPMPHHIVGNELFPLALKGEIGRNFTLNNFQQGWLSLQARYIH